MTKTKTKTFQLRGHSLRGDYFISHRLHRLHRKTLVVLALASGVINLSTTDCTDCTDSCKSLRSCEAAEPNATLNHHHSTINSLSSHRKHRKHRVLQGAMLLLVSGTWRILNFDLWFLNFLRMKTFFNTNDHKPLGRWPRAVAISREKQWPVNFRECFFQLISQMTQNCALLCSCHSSLNIKTSILGRREWMAHWAGEYLEKRGHSYSTVVLHVRSYPNR